MKKLLLNGLFLIFLLPLISQAADEEPLLPGKAFPMTAKAKDANTVQVEFSLAKGYYLYHDKFRFTSDTQGITLGKPVLPAGKKKKDDFFGEVEIHRGLVTIEIPITRAANAPDTLELKGSSQGCADLGICYPPYEQKASIKLPAAVAAATTGKTDPISKISGLGKSFGLEDNSQEFLPADQAFAVTTEVVSGNILVAHWKIADKYYLYRDKFRFTLKDAPAGVSLGEAQLPEGEEKHDEYFGKIRVFHHEVIARIPVNNAAGKEVSVELRYQGCAEAGLCYPPQFKLVTLKINGNGAAETTGSTPPAASTDKAQTVAAPGAKLSDEERLQQLFKQGNIIAILVSLLGFGLLLAFTACMYPMIPILSSIIVGQGEKVTASKGFVLSLVYVEAMAITFGVIGGIFGYVGKAVNVQAYFQEPWVIILFSLLFVLLALSMFGFYNIQIPSALQSKLNEISNRQKGGSLVGVAIMGILSALIIGPCGGPILLATIAGAATSDSTVLGFLYMFMLGNGMGLPLLAVGLGGGKLLPRAGTWMDSVKATAGVILLAISILLLERILEPRTFMLMWATLFMVVAVYMGGFDAIAEGASGWRKLWKGLGRVLFVYGIVVLVGGLTGARNVNDPLHGSSLLGGGGKASIAMSSNAAYEKFAQGKKSVVKGGLTFVKIKTVEEFERERKAANAAGHTVMLDFYADWCTYCKQFDDYVFSEAKVQQALSNTVLLQADITKNDAEDTRLLNHLKVITAPAMLFFNLEGVEQRKERVLGFMKADQFLGRVNKAFK